MCYQIFTYFHTKKVELIFPFTWYRFFPILSAQRKSQDMNINSNPNSVSNLCPNLKTPKIK